MKSEIESDMSDECDDLCGSCKRVLLPISTKYFDSELVKLDIFTAASIGDVNTVAWIAECDISKALSVNWGGWTPLMYACYFGHREIVSQLLGLGCDPEVRNLVGRTALILAAMCGNDEIIKCLIQNGSNINSCDHRDWNALFHATYLGHHSTVKLLLQFGANPNTCESKCGFTPLILAASEGHELILQYLLQHGGCIDKKTFVGETAKQLAQIKGFTKVVNLIDVHMKAESNLPTPNLQEGPAALYHLITGIDKLKPDHQSLCLSQNNSCKNAECKNSVQEYENLLPVLSAIGLEKYYSIFEEQDVDLQVFLTLTDSDLKEIGISLLGPRRKMTSAIARWHSNAPVCNRLEGSYADKLEVEMQEMGVHLQKAFGELDKVKKQLKQEHDLRAVAESCLSQQKTFICEILQHTYDAEHHLDMIKSNLETANYKNNVHSFISFVKLIGLHVDSVKKAIQNVTIRGNSRLEILNEKAAS